MKVITKHYDNFTWHDCQNPSFDDLKTLNFPEYLPDNFLEDSIELGHLPKYEKHGGCELIIFRIYSKDRHPDIINISQISNKIAFIVFDKTIYSIHRNTYEFLSLPHQDFKSRELLLLYLTKWIINSFEEPLDKNTRAIDEMEKNLLLGDGSKFSIEKVYNLKSRARIHKKILQITQHVLHQVAIVNPSNKTELQDIKDSILNLLITSEEIIEDTHSLYNSYLSITAQKNNDVMKVLTIFSIFFLPLSFLTGVYGMNFDYIPELKWEYSYFIFWGLLCIICVAIWMWLKKSKIL